MKKITLYLFLFLSFSLIAQNNSNQNIITNDLVEFMTINLDNELIPINIMLVEKYPTSQLYNQLRQLNYSDKRALVVNELKSFSKQSQSNLRSYLSAEALKNEVVIEHNFWITNVISCKATASVINELSLRDDIRKIDHNEVQNMFIGDEKGIPIKPNSIGGTREITNNVIKVNAPAVWDLGFTGQGVVVAVLDVGVNYNHVDLADHMWEHPDYPFHGYDFHYNDNDPMDNNGHGTHCAGTVAGDGTAGSQTGMAPDATIMALKVLNDGGGGQESNVWEAIEFTVEYGGNIISLSLGWPHSYNPARATWRNTLDNALAAGVVAAVAAGNAGGSTSSPDDVGTPGDCPPPWLNPDQILQGGISAVVCVGATNNNDGLASFSSRGPSSWENVNPFNDYPFNPETGLLRPDVSAPGVNIKSCNAFNINGYTMMSGTSMAAPGVAGVMALLMSKMPNATPQAIDIALETTSVDLGASGKDNLFGAGRIDAFDAINSMTEMFPPIDLQINTDQETGFSTLTWNHNAGIGFQYFKIYRNDEEIDTTSAMIFEDQLPEYGYYTYNVTAFYEGNVESGSAVEQTQWGSSTIEIIPDYYIAIVKPDSLTQQTMIIKNTGILELTYSLSPFLRNVKLVDWITIDPDNGTVASGDSVIVTLTINAEGYDIGSYIDSINFITNDLDVPHYYVPVNMIVSNLEISANANPLDVCFGDSTQLSVDVSGSLGSLIYSWTSIPEGFTSTESNPVFKPLENTEYFVSVSDSIVTLDASVMVTVLPVPEVNLGDDQILCGETQYDLDAGNPGDTYLWSTDETTQTIVATGIDETMYWAEVTNANGCSSIDTIYLNFASIPEVNLGDDQVLCGETQYNLDAGNPGDIYLWSTDETTQAIVATGIDETMYWAEVTNANGCSSIDTIYLNFASIPEINLGADTAVCGDINITLNAENPGSTYLWSNGETSQTIVADTLGFGYGIQDFSVEVITEVGCVNNSGVSIEFVNCTGIDEHSSFAIRYYPNPTSGLFNIEFKGDVKNSIDIRIMDIAGVTIYSLDNIHISGVYTQNIDIRNFANGTYTLLIIHEGISTTRKIILRK